MKIGYAPSPSPQSQRWRRTWLVAGGVLGIVFLVLFSVAGIYFAQLVHGPYISKVEFDSATWQAAPKHDPSHNSVRLRMVDSFLSTQSPIGKSREQIVAMLGQPEDKEFFRDYDLVYYLGRERGSMMNIDSEWLVFKLANGLVVEARLVTD